MGIFKNNRRNTHLLIAGLSAGLALGLSRRSKWKVPHSTFAPVELGNTFISFHSETEEESKIKEFSIPENSNSAVVKEIERRSEIIKTPINFPEKY